MTKYTRSTSQGNFIMRATNDSNKFVKYVPPNLTALPKDMYHLFNQFQLTQSRLNQLKQFQYLAQQVKKFNSQLKQWKQNNGPQIKNFRMVYSLYQNLYSRIRFFNQSCTNKQDAIISLSDVIKWFTEQKPKVRGAPPKKPEPLLKPFQENLSEKQQLDDMTNYTMRKREMTPYEQMSRTAHKNFFPPKERLMDYHKKQFILNKKLTIDGDQLREERITRTASMKRTFTSSLNGDSKLHQTSTNFKNFSSSFKKGSITNNFSSKTSLNQKQKGSTNIDSHNQIEQLQQMESHELKNLQIGEFNLDNIEDKPFDQNAANDQQKIVQKEEILNQLIEEPKFQEDQQDEQEDDIVEEEIQNNKYKKVFESDYRHSSLAQAEQNVKDQQQSTIKRLLKNKEMLIQHKLQDLNVKDKMNNWAKTRSFINQQINRKSQSYRWANDFHKTQYSKKGFFQKRKQIPEFEFKIQRGKTTQNPVSIQNIEKTIEKRKVDNLLKSFGRYINSHVKISPVDQDNDQDQTVQIMRATSLTAFNKKGKIKQLGQILASNQIDFYNQEVNDQVTTLKQKLGKKMISISKNKIFSALSAVKTQRLDSIKVFPKTMSLLSNPFFPKHLYETKKKKKK